MSGEADTNGGPVVSSSNGNFSTQICNSGPTDKTLRFTFTISWNIVTGTAILNDSGVVVWDFLSQVVGSGPASDSGTGQVYTRDVDVPPCGVATITFGINGSCADEGPDQPGGSSSTYTMNGNFTCAFL
jgi:hypothetical protein